MTSRVQIRRRIKGAAGAPGAANMREGEIALNFIDGPNGTHTPEFWAFDGGAWQRVNPPANITTQSIQLGAAGANIGAAYTTWAAGAGNSITGNVVIATWGTPAGAYVLTNPSAPGNAASWTSLGGAVTFATAAQVHAGTDTAGALNSKLLRDETLAAPSGGTAAATDADRIVRLNAAGQIAAAFLPATPTHMRGGVDPTAALTQPLPAAGGAYVSGDIVFANKAGTVDASWSGAAGETVKSGDMLLFDGAAWHIVPNETDLNAYVKKAGDTMDDGAKLSFDTTTGQGGAGAASIIVIDADGGTIDNAVVDCGTY